MPVYRIKIIWWKQVQRFTLAAILQFRLNTTVLLALIFINSNHVSHYLFFLLFFF